jgi:hypothetical protein
VDGPEVGQPAGVCLPVFDLGRLGAGAGGLQIEDDVAAAPEVQPGRTGFGRGAGFVLGSEGSGPITKSPSTVAAFREALGLAAEGIGHLAGRQRPADPL